MRLSEFDYVVKHRKGEDNPVADFLSRWATTCLHAYDEHEARQATAQLYSLEAALTEEEREAGIVTTETDAHRSKAADPDAL